MERRIKRLSTTIFIRESKNTMDAEYFWNTKALLPPPTNTYKAIKLDTDVVKLRSVLQQAKTHFCSEDFLIRETALLSKMVYRLKAKFRNSKNFKTFSKLKRALNIYFKTDLTRHLKVLLELTPTSFDEDTYLPTKNMISYVLVRIQGLAKLMERIYETCKIAAHQISLKLRTGHFWKLDFLIYAVVSRIYILTRFNTKILCDIYVKLLPHFYKLQHYGKDWLPRDYIFPGDLREWMAVPWVYEDDYIDLTVEPTITDVFNLLNLIDDRDDDVEFCDEYILINEEGEDDDDVQIMSDFRKMKPVKDIINSTNRMRGFSINEDDIGEEVASIVTKKNQSKKKVIQKQQLNDIDSIFSILKNNDKKQKSKKSKRKTNFAVEAEENCIIIPDTPPIKKMRKEIQNPSINVSNCIKENKLTKTPVEGNDVANNNFQIKHKESTRDDAMCIILTDTPERKKIKVDLENKLLMKRDINDQDDAGVIYVPSNSVKKEHKPTNNDDIIVIDDNFDKSCKGQKRAARRNKRKNKHVRGKKISKKKKKEDIFSLSNMFR